MLPNPKLVAIIGRLPPEHKDQYAVLRSRLTGVSITTYNEILEFRRAELERIAALSLVSGSPARAREIEAA